MVVRWCRCPRCGFEHFIKVRPDTRIKNFPAYCKNEILVTIESGVEEVNS
ncbi:conjugal transfer protein [bacterium 0.1xD8-71]|nr:conjugal transfer protein [bacterium 0.1xD8-71]